MSSQAATTDYLTFGYAALVALGGIMGYVKAGSLPSLGAGLAFGAVIGAGGVLTSRDPKNIWVVLGASAVLAGVMGMRFVRSGKVMPAGLVCALSLMTAGRMVYQMIK